MLFPPHSLHLCFCLRCRHKFVPPPLAKQLSQKQLTFLLAVTGHNRYLCPSRVCFFFTVNVILGLGFWVTPGGLELEVVELIGDEAARAPAPLAECDGSGCEDETAVGGRRTILTRLSPALSSPADELPEINNEGSGWKWLGGLLQKPGSSLVRPIRLLSVAEAADLLPSEHNITALVTYHQLHVW